MRGLNGCWVAQAAWVKQGSFQQLVVRRQCLHHTNELAALHTNKRCAVAALPSIPFTLVQLEQERSLLANYNAREVNAIVPIRDRTNLRWNRLAREFAEESRCGGLASGRTEKESVSRSHKESD